MEKKKVYLVLKAQASGNKFDGEIEQRGFKGKAPTLEQLQDGVGGYIEPVDYAFYDPSTGKPYAGMENVSFLVNEEGVICGLPLNLVARVYGGQQTDADGIDFLRGRLPLFGDIVAYVPEEYGGGGFTDEQVQMVSWLYMSARLERNLVAWENMHTRREEA